MNRSVKGLLFWTPRILCMLFAAFVSVFALDVFDAGLSIWKTMLALLIHLSPVFFLILILVLSWRWAWVGGIVFPALGALYIVWAWHRFHWPTYAIIAGPLFLLGILFWINWLCRAQLRAKV
jgi:hypothetical protein